MSALAVAKARRERSRRIALDALSELESELAHIRAALTHGEQATGRYGSAVQRLLEACGGYDAALEIVTALEVSK